MSQKRTFLCAWEQSFCLFIFNLPTLVRNSVIVYFSKRKHSIVPHLSSQKCFLENRAKTINTVTPPTFLVKVEHSPIVWGSSGQRRGVMPKLGFYDGFYIHLMILQASVSWVDYPYMPVLSSFYMQSRGWVNNIHSAYNIQDYTRQTA